MVKKPVIEFDRIVYLFHGGGALGAYQIGVFEGLCEKGYLPDWIIGTSIGAINSAILAGNAPEKRVKKLREFWHTIATKMPPTPDTLNNILMERWQHFLSALITTYCGQPGFFRPRLWNPWFAVQSTADKLSYYSTDELRSTLAKFIDFERINDCHIRLSLGAVHVATGNLIYFDNTKMKLTLEHVMASAALPPGFPAICIDDQFYWDGGVHSNTQINLLLCEREPLQYLCFMVHLFDSYGTRPTNMDDVYKRQKDIFYSSHHRQAIYTYKVAHNLRHAIRVLSEEMPESKKNDPEIKKLIDLGRTGIIHIARFHYKGKLSDLSSKDYDFSLPTVDLHIKNGYDDVNKALVKPPWYNYVPPDDIGLILYEVSENRISDNPFEEITNYYPIT